MQKSTYSPSRLMNEMTFCRLLQDDVRLCFAYNVKSLTLESNFIGKSLLNFWNTNTELILLIAVATEPKSMLEMDGKYFFVEATCKEPGTWHLMDNWFRWPVASTTTTRTTRLCLEAGSGHLLLRRRTVYSNE